MDVLSEDRLREGSDVILTEDETILQMVRLEGLYPHERQRYHYSFTFLGSVHVMQTVQIIKSVSVYNGYF